MRPMLRISVLLFAAAVRPFASKDPRRVAYQGRRVSPDPHHSEGRDQRHGGARRCGAGLRQPVPRQDRSGYMFPLPHDARGGPHDHDGGFARDRRPRTQACRSAGDLRCRAGKRTGSDPAAPGTPQRLHPSRGEHHARRKIQIRISYVQTLGFEAGRYEFVFPMVVGPRYPSGGHAGRRAPLAPDRAGGHACRTRCFIRSRGGCRRGDGQRGARRRTISTSPGATRTAPP